MCDRRQNQNQNQKQNQNGNENQSQEPCECQADPSAPKARCASCGSEGVHAVRLVLDAEQRAEKYPLHRHYPGQTNAQDAFLQLEPDGKVTAGYNPEIGNAVLEGVVMGRILRWEIPNRCTVLEIETLFGEVKHLLQRIHDGRSIEWDGRNRMGVLNDDAKQADDLLDDFLEGWRELIQRVGHYTNCPEDWPQEDDGVEADTPAPADDLPVIGTGGAERIENTPDGTATLPQGTPPVIPEFQGIPRGDSKEPNFKVINRDVYLYGYSFPVSGEMGVVLECRETGKSVGIDLGEMEYNNSLHEDTLTAAFLAACSEESGKECKTCKIAGFTGRLEEVFDEIGGDTDEPLEEHFGWCICLDGIVKKLLCHHGDTCAVIMACKIADEFGIERESALETISGPHDSRPDFARSVVEDYKDRSFFRGAWLAQFVTTRQVNLDMENVIDFANEINLIAFGDYLCVDGNGEWFEKEDETGEFWYCK